MTREAFKKALDWSISNNGAELVDKVRKVVKGQTITFADLEDPEHYEYVVKCVREMVFQSKPRRNSQVWEVMEHVIGMVYRELFEMATELGYLEKPKRQHQH